jgi:outer membrane receptor protein involved in Fe transport
MKQAVAEQPRCVRKESRAPCDTAPDAREPLMVGGRRAMAVSKTRSRASGARRRALSAAAGALALIVAVARPAAAQAVYGSVAGTVRDPSGAAVPGATVTITSTERKSVAAVTTNASGFYVKGQLLPGRYDVKAEVGGFQGKVVPSVVVSVDTQTKVDFTLAVGDLTEEVVVEASEGQLLKTDRSDVSVTFERKQVAELPVLSRNFTKFLLLTPGTQTLGWQQNAAENPQGSALTQVNGQSFANIGYQLDGTDNRDAILGLIVVNPTLESIAESKFTAQNYNAEFGQASAGLVSVQTKSGSNEFHGSAYEFLQRDKFQARNPFTQFQRNPATGKFIPDSRRDQFGGSLGGPIARNKFFFFGSYERTQADQGSSLLLTVPTLKARTGDLSEYTAQIFDPAGGPPASRSPFPGNVIPPSRLSPQALAILQLVPVPNAPGTANGTRDNFIASDSTTTRQNTYNVRLDGRISKKLNVFGRYSHFTNTLDAPVAFGRAGGPGFGANSFGGTSESKHQSVAAGLDYTLSATSVLDVRFGFLRYKVNVLPFDYGTTPVADAGIPGLNLDTTFTSGLPALLLGDLGTGRAMNLGSSLAVNACNCPLAQDEKVFQLAANFTKLVGNHTLKMGVDLRRAYNLRVPSDRHRGGELPFAPELTRGPTGGGSGLAAFLLGLVGGNAGGRSGFERFVSASTDARERQWRHAYYAQDTWRPNRKVTLNYGLRLTIINPETVNEPGNGARVVLETGEALVAGRGGVPLNMGVENSLNWGPSVGVTYQFNEKTVLRTGYGRSYDMGIFGSTFGHSVTQNLPVLASQQVQGANNFDSVFTLAQGPPAPTFIDADRFMYPNGVSFQARPPKQRLGALDAWNVTVQRQLGDKMSVEGGYVGNKGTHVFMGDGGDINPNAPTIIGFGTLTANQRRPYFNGPVTGIDGGSFGAPYGWTQQIRYHCQCGDNRYNALQAKLVRRFADGWSLLSHYTFQVVRNYSSDGNPLLQRSVNYGPTDFWRSHVFQLIATYELPVFKGHRWLGGWQVNTIGLWQSGLPFSVSYRDAGVDRDVGPNRPDLIGDPQVGSGDGIAAPYFNNTAIGATGSAFGRPARGTFGNLKRNAFRGPAFWNVDASLFKRFRIRGASELEFRLEVQNVFNHVNFGIPDTTVGIVGNDNPGAGFITGVDVSWLPRNLQFAFRFIF